MKKVGFFGGTFDPIHLGHINIAIQLMENAGLDQVLFCPTSLSPLKQSTPPIASSKQRSEMVRLAIEDIQQFSILDLEVAAEEVSYTVDTLEALHMMGGGKIEYFILLAEDLLADFHRWKNPEKIIELAKPLVGTRLGSTDHNFEHDAPEVRSALLAGIQKIVSTEVSSTYVRERLKKKLYCSHLLPPKVVDYITQNGLYY